MVAVLFPASGAWAQPRLPPNISERYTTSEESNISPPTVDAPIDECAPLVSVSGFVPKAEIRVFANYVAFGSIARSERFLEYHGWVMAYRASDLAFQSPVNTLKNYAPSRKPFKWEDPDDAAVSKSRSGANG